VWIKLVWVGCGYNVCVGGTHFDEIDSYINCGCVAILTIVRYERTVGFFF